VTDTAPPTTTRSRKIATAAIAVAALGYAGIVGGMALGQRSMLFLTADQGQLAAAGGIAVPGSERVSLTTSDGMRIAGWYAAPRPGQPVFLFLHGQGGRLVVQNGRWRRIADAGAGVLAISYRGYPGSDGEPSEDGLIRDARAAYDWLAQRHAVRDIVIHGYSLGTGVAVALAADVPARGLVLEAPFTAAVDLANERYPLLPVRLLMRDPFLSRERISRVTMPILIVHGDRDSVVPFAHGERLYELAPRLKRLVRMTGSEHNTLVRDGLYTHVWSFLGREAAAGARP
jgi:hypothetical protein